MNESSVINLSKFSEKGVLNQKLKIQEIAKPVNGSSRDKW